MKRSEVGIFLSIMISPCGKRAKFPQEFLLFNIFMRKPHVKEKIFLSLNYLIENPCPIP